MNTPGNAEDARDMGSIPSSPSGEDPLKKEMLKHSSILAWKISGTEEPGGLQSMGWQRVRHDWACERTDTHTYHRVPYSE